MKIIAGLGNPGREYAATRHNLGFLVVDAVARRLSATTVRTRFRAEISEALDGSEKIVLLKPQTYMNLSGVSVREAAHWYKVKPEDILVVADDIDLPFGTLRMRAGGGSGGHNGIKSIATELGTDQVPRLRIGVGRGSGDATRQVLTRFNDAETQALSHVIQAAADCAVDWVRVGVINAMNRCNRKPDSLATEETLASAGTPTGT